MLDITICSILGSMGAQIYVGASIFHNCAMGIEDSCRLIKTKTLIYLIKSIIDLNVLYRKVPDDRRHGFAQISIEDDRLRMIKISVYRKESHKRTGARRYLPIGALWRLTPGRDVEIGQEVRALI